MVLKLYGFVFSTNTQRVIHILKELDVPFEFVLVNLRKGEQKSPDFLKKQPFGVVPFIEDDGLQLFESRAICRYIVARYAPGSFLVPTEPKAQALFEQAVSIEASYFGPPAGIILQEKVIAKYLGKETDEARYEEAVKKIEHALDIYDTILGKQKYLGGDELTMADLFHIPLGRAVYSVVPEVFSKRANVTRWWSDLTARPASVAVAEAVKEGTF